MEDDAIHANHHIQHRYPAEVRFCALCGTEMEIKVVLPDRKRQRVCPKCGFVFFASPKLVSGCLAVKDGKVLLLKRGIEPEVGAWTFPGGFVEFGEPASETAIRETAEEVGLNVRLGRLLGVYTDVKNAKAQVVVYLAEPISGEARTTEEATEVRYFAPGEIRWNTLAFTSTVDALAEWCESVKAAR